MDRRTVLAAPLALFAIAAAPKEKPEVRVVSAAAVQGPVEAIAAKFTAKTGIRVRFEFGTAGEVDAKLKAGALADLVITNADRAAILEPDARRRFALGAVRVGVALRPDTPRPDLSTVESFTSALQQAGTIAEADPALGATTGVHFAKVFATLHFADGARPKIVLGANGADVVQRVARGEANLGITQISEILHTNPAMLAGPLPETIQLVTTYAAMLRAPQATGARAFLAALHDKAGAAEFKKAGFQ